MCILAKPALLFSVFILQTALLSQICAAMPMAAPLQTRSHRPTLMEKTSGYLPGVMEIDEDDGLPAQNRPGSAADLDTTAVGHGKTIVLEILKET